MEYLKPYLPKYDNDDDVDISDYQKRKRERMKERILKRLDLLVRHNDDKVFKEHLKELRLYRDKVTEMRLALNDMIRQLSQELEETERYLKEQNGDDYVRVWDCIARPC